jgi:hypothetical protein
MAKSKKRGPVRKERVRGKARKTSKARGKAAKRPSARTKPKRAVATKKVRAMKPGASVETVIVDVVEQPAPGVITVTEFEETGVTRPGGNETDE